MKRLFPLILLLLVPLAAGSYISISVTLSTEVTENYTRVHVSLEQLGDEAAYEIEVVPFSSEYFAFGGEVKKDKLYPQEKLRGVFEVYPKKELKEGSYPFVAKIVYHDANRYPFSIIAFNPINYGKVSASEVVGSIKNLDVEEGGFGGTVLKIKNSGERRREVRVKLYLPNELKGNVEKEKIVLAPGEEKNLNIEITTRGALKGSSYSIGATLEYEDERHHTFFATGLVRVVERKEGKGLLWWLEVIFIVLLSIFIYLKVSAGERSEGLGGNSHTKRGEESSDSS